MSKVLIQMILSFCPGYEMHNGQVITTACQERMVNCAINKAGISEVTEEHVAKCRDELKSKYRSSSEVDASDLLEK